jgi:selenide, water dikinase
MKIDFLKMAEHGGCSAKISPKQLEEILKYLPLPKDPDILVGIDTHDDAGVYRVNDELALVFTAGFFPPVCSDPYEFGQIAAANSINDVYAMGGDPVIALNIMMFPAAKLPVEVFGDVLKGGFDKATEAGVKIIGGHTIDDSTPKYGLAVVGYIHPDKIITNAGAKPGDGLILTKPLGTGIILDGERLGLADSSDIAEAQRVMKLLDKTAAGVMKRSLVECATDINGFGLAGHAMKMAKASNVSVKINMKKVPLIGNTYKLVEKGCIPGSSFRNLVFIEEHIHSSPDLNYNFKMIACDAQTSGGLLMAVSPYNIESVLKSLRSAGLASSALIGEVIEKKAKSVFLEN